MKFLDWLLEGLGNGINAVGNAITSGLSAVSDFLSSGNKSSSQTTSTPTAPTTQAAPSAPATPPPSQSAATSAPPQTSSGAQTVTPSDSSANSNTNTGYQSQYSNGAEGTTGSEGTTSEQVSDGSDIKTLSYGEFLINQQNGLDYIKSETTEFYDNQNKETLAALDEKKAKDDQFALEEKNQTYESLEEQKQSVYNYAEELLSGSLSFNQEAYNKIVGVITEQMEAGKLNAEEAKNLLLDLAEQTKTNTYGTAERQRAEAEKNADIYRERAAVDAQSAGAQSRANYGARAEMLGSMGITGGGYSDWVNNSSYATERSEVQKANANAEEAKREAKYAEDILKLDADKTYNQQKYAAESEYNDKIYNIESTYASKLLEADQNKLAKDKEAQDLASGMKFEADQLESQGKAAADKIYADRLYTNESEYKTGVLSSNQATAAGKHQAEMDYVTNVMMNDERIAQYAEELRAGDAAAEEKKQAMFAEILTQAGNGELDGTIANALADLFEFDDDMKTKINDAVTSAESKAASDNNKAAFLSLFDAVKSGNYDAEDVTNLAGQLGLTDESLIGVLQSTAGKVKTEEAKEDFINLFMGAADGSLSESEIDALASKIGLPESDVTQLKEIAKGNASENEQTKFTDNKNAVMSDVTPTTSDADIDRLVSDGYIGSSEAQDLKNYRNELSLEDINSTISSGDLAGAIAKAEEYYKNGYISPEKYMETYYNTSIVNAQSASSAADVETVIADLDNLVSDKKMTSVTANNIKNYLYQIAGHTAGATITANGITVGDVSVPLTKLTSLSKAGTKEQRILDEISKAQNGEKIVMLGDKIYVNGNEGWVEIGLNDTTKAFYDEFVLKSGQKKPTTPPKFTYGGGTTSSGYTGSTGAGAGPNGNLINVRK